MPRYEEPLKNMIKQAMEELNGYTTWLSPKEIKQKIHDLFDARISRQIKDSSIGCHLIALSINHTSRTKYRYHPKFAFILYDLNNSEYRLLTSEELSLYERARNASLNVIKKHYFTLDEMRDVVEGRQEDVIEGEVEESEEIIGVEDYELDETEVECFMFVNEPSFMEPFLIKNWRLIDWGKGLTFIQNQFKCGEAGTLDILAKDDDGNYHVIELKRDKSGREVVGQIQGYMAWIREKKADPEGKEVFGIIVAKEIDKEMEWAAKFNANLTIKTYQLQFTLN